MNVLNISWIVIALASIVTGRGIFSPNEIEDEYQLNQLFDRDLEDNVYKQNLLEDPEKVLNFKLKLSDLLELKLSTSVKPSQPKPTEGGPKPSHPTPTRPTDASPKPPHSTPPKPTEGTPKPPHATPPRPTDASPKPPHSTPPKPTDTSPNPSHTTSPTSEPPKSTTTPSSLSSAPAKFDPSEESSQSSVLSASSSETLSDA